MALLRPNKGTAPSTGKVKPTKPTRAELLMSATQALAVEQIPEVFTMTAIEGEPARVVETPPETAQASTQTPPDRPPPDRPPPDRPPPDRPPPDRPPPAQNVAAESHPAEGAREGVTLIVRELPVDTIRPSPFQPKGRPSAAAVAAVRQAVVDTGSLEALVSPDGAAAFSRLAPEAARLAELAYDVAEHGMKVPVETRVLGDGTLECLSGHRRLAAAKLAGKDTVPAIERGEMSNASAAATVLRGNLHRENFTTWQEATLVTEVQERRRADGYRDNVRTLGTVMGWSHGKVNMLLRIRRALSPELLTRVGGGDPSPVEELLARAQYRDLERLAAEPDEHRRETATRRMLGLDDRPAASPRDRQVCVHRPKRGGGFVIEVNAAVESLDAGDASLLRAHLETQLTRVTARLGALGHN